MTIDSNRYTVLTVLKIEKNRDTVVLGDTVDFSIGIENMEYDSLVFYLGEMNENDPMLPLKDTVDFIATSTEVIFFTFVPQVLGEGRIEGHLKEFKEIETGFAVKTIPFSKTYYCIKN